ncbi:MAG: DUF99 family protein [Candidatus Heimdallarchaeota archaeon]|nr:DUF99 family protein [Candidatus Heimdallarchaeota archaeon]
MKWIQVKEKTPIIGIDDAPFDFQKNNKTLIFGVVMKGSEIIEDVLSTNIDIDAKSEVLTQDFATMINETTQKGQLRAQLLNGITFGGFGIIDLQALYRLTNIPTISIVDHQPDLERIKYVLKQHFDDGDKRWEIMKKNGEPERIILNGKEVFVQYSGIEKKTTELLLKKSTKPGFTQPEAIRIAHMIGGSLKQVLQKK